MSTFWAGMNIVSVILQFLGVLAAAVCGGALIISAVCFVIGGIMKFWFDDDKDDGLTGAQRCWNRIWNRQEWSKQGEDEGLIYEGCFVNSPQAPTEPPEPQDVRKSVIVPTERNVCVCRSCPSCDTVKAAYCPARKCERCSGGESVGADIGNLSGAQRY